MQALLAAFVTIFLGAIGSGLWQLVLARLFQAFANGFLTTLSRIFHGYVDLLHRNIGKGPSGQLEVLPYVLIVSALVMGPWIMLFTLISSAQRLRRRILRAIDGREEDVTPQTLLAHLDRTRKRALWLIIPLACLASLLYTEDLIETSYAVRAATFLERSIEIVGPVVDRQTLLHLRASYRSIDNAKKFYALEDEIRAIARGKDISLPEFKSIR